MLSNPAASEELLRMADAHKQEHQPRSPGMHASDLIYCRRKSWYRRQRGLTGGSSEDETLDVRTLALFLMGQGHHAIFQRCIPEHEEHYTLTDSDGTTYEIVGTPDMDWPEHIGLDPRLPRPPGEIKTTRFSAEKVPDRDIPHYVEQLATYCLMRRIRQGRLYVYHLNGDYNSKRGGNTGMSPILKCYEFEFSNDELAAWGDALAWRAFQVVNGDERGGPPEGVGTHYAWECGYCPFNRSKGGPCNAPAGMKTGFFVAVTLPVWMQDVTQ